MSSIEVETAYEIAFPRALEGIAQGATRSEVDSWVGRVYPILTAADRKRLLADALDDAMSCGVEREDIDPSFFRR